jgi:hypothetical protein
MNGDRMEIVVIAAIVAVGFGAAATWLIATRLPLEWMERGQNEGRFASPIDTAGPRESDFRRQQAGMDTRRVRRARIRANSPATRRRSYSPDPSGAALKTGSGSSSAGAD